MNSQPRQTHFTTAQALSTYMDADTYCVTVNARLARTIGNPSTFSFEEWEQFLYQHLVDAQLAPARSLLTPWQTESLWGKVIRQHSPSPIRGTLIQEAYLAYTLLERWQVDGESLKNLHHYPSQLLLQWIAIYQQQLNQLNVCDILTRNRYLLAGLKNSQKISLPFRKLLLIGFDDIWPQLETLLKLLEKLSIAYQFIQLHTKPKKITAKVFPSHEEEILGILQYLQEKLISYPEAKLSCVLPNTLNLRDELKIHCQRLLQASTSFFLHQDENLPLNFSIGSRLAEYPFIQHFLRFIKLDLFHCPLADISLLIRSPYLNFYEQEKFARAQFDFKLRTMESAYVSLAFVVHALKRKKEHFKLYQILSCYLKKRKKLRNIKLQPSKWAQYFNLLIKYFTAAPQWLSKTELSLLQRLQEACQEFSACDAFYKNISYQKACSLLENLLRRIIYQPATTQSSIHIMGVLEAAGLNADVLWIGGLTQAQWPFENKPNIFLPLSMQRAYNLPHSSLQREYAYCQKLTARLLTSAHEIILSYSQRDKEEEQNVSALVAEYFLQAECVSTAMIPRHWEEMFMIGLRNKCGVIKGAGGMTNAMPLNTTEVFQAPSRLFHLQASCPFRAMGELRLHAQPLEFPKPGFSPRLRGQILHRCLEKIWKDLRSSSALSNFTAAQLENFIAATLDEFTKKYPCVIYGKRRLLEQQRLQKMLSAWLEYEKQRGEFTVKEVEARITLTIHSLEFKLRVDRIDQLADGRHLLIDYKTGPSSLQLWFGNRPENLQLPLYAHAYKNKLAGIAFAYVGLHECEFKGMADDENTLPDVATAYQGKILTEQIAVWQNQLANLAQEFCDGVAEVAPLTTATCDQCHLSALCRIEHSVVSHDS